MDINIRIDEFNLLLYLCASQFFFQSSVCFSQEQVSQLDEIETIIVTANKREQSIQKISASIIAISADEIQRNNIIDITGLEQVVVGLKIGRSGSEVRPAMRGARTNEVGVAGTGIAEQVVGIFQDGIYIPTTTAGLAAFVDIDRIEVLRGPQGTLYGRNTFAGSINVITNQPLMDEVEVKVSALKGAYNRNRLLGIFNLPLYDDISTRLVMLKDEHDGYINNHYLQGKSDDLREKHQIYLRSVTQFEPSDNLKTSIRVDYSNKDANSEAIWGYQQIAGYALNQMENGLLNPIATVNKGHIYQPDNATKNDLGPYNVDRNAISFDKQDTFSITAMFQWTNSLANIKWHLNYNDLNANQFYDNDYSNGGVDKLGGFGRKDKQKIHSSELLISSLNNTQLSWVVGINYFNQKADWAWLWPEDTNSDGTPDAITIPSWGNPEYDPHTATSSAAFGQLNYKITPQLRTIVGLRYNRDKKTFTGNTTQSWRDNALLYKGAFEYDFKKNIMLYISSASGYRTGGANDVRVVSRGANPFYDNEEVVSNELGLKSQLFQNKVHFNLAFFTNQYKDVKAQLFAVACNDVTLGNSVLECVEQSQYATFEYYENGGAINSKGIEAQLNWQPLSNLVINSAFTWLNSQFSESYKVGNPQLRPLLGLGDLDGRQDINNPNSQFSFDGWRPAMSPEYTANLSFRYEYAFGQNQYLIPYINFDYSDDYYAFDTNIPEVKVDKHTIVNANISWLINDNFQIDFFIKNATNQAVLNRAVVHSQIVNNLPANSVQANWNDPRTWGVNFKYQY